MKLTEIQIDCCGVWHNLTLPVRSHGVSVYIGPNEAGKTALLQALQQVNPPPGIRKFDPLRDYPRSEYNDITTGKVRPEDVTIMDPSF